MNEEYTKLNKANTKQQKELDLIRKESSDRTQKQLKEFAKNNPEIGLQKIKRTKKTVLVCRIVFFELIRFFVSYIVRKNFQKLFCFIGIKIFDFKVFI